MTELRMLRKGQSKLLFDAAVKFSLEVTTKKGMSFQYVLPSIAIDNFKHRYY